MTREEERVGSMSTAKTRKRRDADLATRLGKLHVAAVSDSLDQVGIRQNVMASRIRPLVSEAKLAGFAATVRLVEVDSAPADMRDWYRGEIKAIDGLREGDVIVVSTCQGSYWGELLATASRNKGAQGIVADAYTRDTEALIRMKFPTFVAGVSAQDSLGRTDVEAFDVTIECGDVQVAPGDLVIADCDGVAVIPAACARDVIERAEQKVLVEEEMRSDLCGGMTLSDAFLRHKIL
jgi:regulator of RNase E activity RraA